MDYGQKYITYKGKVVFGKQSMPYFDRNPKDYAEHEACFVFVNQGAVSLRAPEEQFELNKEQAVIAKCLNYFFECAPSKRSGDGIEVIAVLLHPPIMEEIFEVDLSLSTFQLSFDIKQVAVNQLLENYKESIRILLDHPELADENMIKAKLKEFVILLTKMEQIPSELDFLAGLFSPLVVSFKKTIQQNLYANLTIEELAHLCHMSTSSFKRKFEEVFHESPKKYITRKKLEKAVPMLQLKTNRISDIAFEVGFKSTSTFNRNFAAAYGMSPSNYRLSHSGA